MGKADPFADLITSSEAAEIIGVTREFVGRMLATSRIIGRKFGREWIVYRPSAEAFAATERVKGRPPAPRQRRR